MKGAVANVDYSVVKELLRERIDPVILLAHYNVDIADRNYRYDKVRCACPLHEGADNPTGFSFDLNTKTFTCFTNHCGESPNEWFFIPKDGGVPRDLFLFIKLMEEKRMRESGNRNYSCSFKQALTIASEMTGIALEGNGYDKDMIDRLDAQKWVRTMSRLNQEVELNHIFDESEIDIFKAMLPMCDYINTRRFDESTLEFFEVGYSMEGIDEPYRLKFKDFPGRIIFPVRDANGSLVGWSGRLATDDKVVIKKHIKWMHKMDFDKGFVLYNFNNAKEHIKESRELILVEGAWDVIRLWSYGIYNVVAVMGSSLTPEQLQLAITSAFKIKVFLDGDGAGASGAKRICEQLKRYVDVYEIKPESNKDPDDLEFHEAWEAVLSAKRYVSDKER